jgi:hypothetical protein
MTAQAVKPTTLQEQARAIRDEFPELFAYLNERDEVLRRAVRRIPSPADVELSATWNYRSYVQKTLSAMGAGVDELAT